MSSGRSGELQRGSRARRFEPRKHCEGLDGKVGVQKKKTPFIVLGWERQNVLVFKLGDPPGDPAGKGEAGLPFLQCKESLWWGRGFYGSLLESVEGKTSKGGGF